MASSMIVMAYQAIVRYSIADEMSSDACTEAVKAGCKPGPGVGARDSRRLLHFNVDIAIKVALFARVFVSHDLRSTAATA